MISLCMIVKNEEHCLEKCLNSVKDCVDEIIIVDTGSEDNTVDIANQYGAKVFFYQWDDDFAAARNFSISKASGDWIIYLDADEELEPNCCHRLRKLAGNPNIEGYYFQINNVNDKNEVLRHINVRMFKNKPQYRFKGRLHEQILGAIVENSQEKNVVVNSGINIFHYGYTASEYFNKNKSDRNYRILKKMLEEKPNDPFHLYNMGNCLINFNDIKGAAKCYSQALKHINFKAAYAPSVFMSYIQCLIKLGRLTEAIKLIQICKSLYPDYVDIYYIEGRLYSQIGNLHQAKVYFEKCLQLGEHVKGRYTSKTGTGSFLPLFELAKLHQSLGDIDKSINYQIQGLKINNSDIINFITLAHLLKSKYKDTHKVYGILSDLLDNKLLLARLLLEINEYELSIKAVDEAASETDDAQLVKGTALFKQCRYNEAIQAFKKINPGSEIYKKALPELIAVHWANTPPQNASNLIQKDYFDDEYLYKYIRDINNILFNQPNALNIDTGSRYFKQIINKLLSYQLTGLTLEILNLCGINTPDKQIDFLTSPPASEEKLELASKLALAEIKKDAHNPQYFYILAVYFLNNEELDMAQNLINKALDLSPKSELYQHLLIRIYYKKLLDIIKEALVHFPSSSHLNKCLINVLETPLVLSAPRYLLSENTPAHT